MCLRNGQRETNTRVGCAGHCPPKSHQTAKVTVNVFVFERQSVSACTGWAIQTTSLI